MTPRPGFLAVLLLLVATLAGCAVKVTPTGALPGGYQRFNAVDEPAVKLRVRDGLDARYTPIMLTSAEIERRERKRIAIPTAEALNLDVQTSQPLLFIVAQPEWGAPTRLDPDDEREVLFTLRERMYRYLLRNYPYPVRVRWAWTGHDEVLGNCRPVVIRTRITEAHTGNGWARYLLGFGVGSAEVQVEGAMFDGLEEKDILAEFAVRQRHGGYAQWGWNPEVFSSRYVLQYAVEAATDNIAAKLPAHIPGAWPRGYQPAPPPSASTTIASTSRATP